MTVAPTDLREWLESFAYSVSDPVAAEFGREALELVENEPFYLECLEIREALEKEASPLGFKEAWRLAEHFTDRSQLLDELGETLKNAGYDSAEWHGIDKALEFVLAKLDDVETELAALKAPAVVLPDGTALEFDL